MARNGKPSFYDEAMETFHRAADLIELNPRVRMELEEPDFEHIFYVTTRAARPARAARAPRSRRSSRTCRPRA